jgi:hypothetical protein
MNIIRGKDFPPGRIVIYGPPGVGKSTFACAAPDALAIDYERGLEEIGVDRVRGAETWTESLKLIKEACTSDGPWETVIIDTIDKLEDQATAHVCKVGANGKSKPDLASFGYGDGYEALCTQWRELLEILERAALQGREVILVAHVQQKQQDDPTMEKPYAKYIPQLSKRCWGATHRWASDVLFANYEAGMVEGRALMTGMRLLHSVSGTGFDAKNRLGLPKSMPLSWSVFQKHRTGLQRSADAVRSSIRALSTPDTKEKAEKFISEAGEDVPRLYAVECALQQKVSA